jgi:ABC-type transport system involved in cytochrome bd biosynthesis fused ATPase/permease subunit
MRYYTCHISHRRLFLNCAHSSCDCIACAVQFNQYTDEQIWEALTAVHLAEMVQTHPQGQGLLMPMAEYGSNLSAGECQLVCVARALLKPVKILLVDEVCSSQLCINCVSVCLKRP